MVNNENTAIPQEYLMRTLQVGTQLLVLTFSIARYTPLFALVRWLQGQRSNSGWIPLQSSGTSLDCSHTSGVRPSVQK